MSEARTPVVRAGPATAALLAAGFVAATLAVGRQGGETTSFAALSPALAALGVLAAVALLAAATQLLDDGRSRRAGLLAMGVALVWGLPVLAAWTAVAGPVRSVATSATGLLAALLLHLIVRSPTRTRPGRTASALVVAGYATATLSTGTWLLLNDPFRDVSCWANCSVNSFLLHSSPRWSDRLQDVARLATAALAMGLVLVCADLVRRATPAARPGVVAVSLAGCTALLAVAVDDVSLVLDPARRPTGPLPVTTYVVSAVALTATGLALLAEVARTRRQRRAVDQLVARLGGAPSLTDVESALRVAVGDPTLRVLFATHEAAYVDAAGAAVPPPEDGAGRVVTVLRREAAPVAWLEHDDRLADVVRRIGPALRLALENAGIQAVLLARLAQLQAMRARIVATSDAERCRLERDLHDGAQQQLLALALDLRLAAAAERAHGATRCSELLDEAAAQAKAAVVELRELAHGLYPAALAESGLAAALATLATRAPIAVEVEASPYARHPAPVEAAAYAVVSDAVIDAHRRSATYLSVLLAESGGTLAIETQDDGAPRTSRMLAVEDRVGALGGRVVVGSSTLRAEVPCG